MTDPRNEPEGGWASGKPTRVCQSLPPVTLEPDATDQGAPDELWSSGPARRVCESLPPVVLVTEEVAPALVLRMNGDPAARADAVADTVLKVFARDRAAGGTGFTRDRSREPVRPDAFTLVLVPNGPAGPEAEARLRDVARLVASATVTADVIPAG